MRRDKTVARILFILSVVHVAVRAAPAKVSRRFLDEAEGLTPALENREDSDDEWPLDLSPLRHPGSAVSMNPYPTSDSEGLSEGSVNSPEPLSGSSRYLDGSVNSPEGSSRYSEEPTDSQSPTHDGSPLSATHDYSSPVSVTQAMYYDSEPGTAEFDDDSHWWTWSPHPSQAKIVPVDSPAYAGSVQSPQDHPWPELGTSPTHDDLFPMSAISPTHGGSPPVSATLPTHGDLSPVSVTPPMHHDPEQGNPEFDDDSHWWTLTPNAPVDFPAHEGSAQPSHGELRPELGAPPLHDDSISKTYVPFWSLGHGADSVVGSSAPESEAPQPHGTLPPISESPIKHAESVPPSVPKDEAVAEGSKAEESKADADRFFTDELKQKIKDYAVLGVVAGISTGFINGMQKEIMGTISPGAQTLGRDLASDVVGHGEGGLLHSLPGHLQSRKKRVSRGLANLIDKDLRLLSVLTRRALERLD